MFPFDQSWPTAFYTVLLAATFGLHFAAAAFVLGGSGWLAVAQLGRPGGAHAITRALVDGLPFAMGAAITLGVAPLLFVQIVDQEGYYTANLLLFHRWMAVLPVLIVAFYLLYLLKGSERVRGHAVWGRLVPLVVFAAVAFVGLSWGENHLLSTARGVWVELYAEGALRYATPELWPRFGIALSTSAVGLAALLGAAPVAKTRRRARTGLAVAGLLGAVASGVVLGGASAGSHPMPTAWATIASLALLVTAIAVVVDRPRFAIASWAVTAIALGFVREAIRSARLADALATEAHRDATEVGGLWLFVAIAVLLGAVAFPVVRAVRRDLTQRADPAPAER